MSDTMWWCIAALLLQSCRAYPTTDHRTTCEDFGRGVTFDPHFALGNWTTVYEWSDSKTVNTTETSIISELTPAQLEEYHDILKDYPNDTSKLLMRIHTIGSATNIELVMGLIVKDTTGDTNAWIIHYERNNHDMTTSAPVVQFSMRLKSADEFLVLMVCSNQRIILHSKTSSVDRAKVERVAADLHIEGVGGANIYPYLSSPYAFWDRH